MSESVTDQVEGDEPIVQLPLLSAPRVDQVILVETEEALADAVFTLSQSTGPFAVDAERASGFKYSQRAYLIQIHRSGTPIYLIDPAAISPDASPQPFESLAAVMATDEWILHAASQDIPCLRELGINPVTVFDTELGSRIGGLPRVGLGAVTEHLLGLKLAKEHSAVDWSIRPLKEDWLNYAALDVDVLIELRSELHKHLIAESKLDWATAEFAHVVNAPPKPPKVDRWRGMTGLHEVKDSKSLSVAESLWLHREELAIKLDVSPGRLIPDYSIVAVSKTTPKTKPELAGSKSFAGRASRSYLDLWWRAIEAGLKNLNPPPVRLPQTGIPNHRIWANRFPEADARLKSARLVIAALSEKHSLPAENILTPDFLRQIAWEPPGELTASAVADALAASGARAWQIELLAELLAEALANPIEVTTPETDLP